MCSVEVFFIVCLSLQVFEYVFNIACQSKGINLVLIPWGIYLLRPIVLNGPCNGLLEFVIIGTLKAPTDKVFSINVDNWITFQHIDGLIITGGGKLDGQGPSAWNENNCSKDPNCKTLPIVSFYINKSILNWVKKNGVAHDHLHGPFVMIHF